MEPCDFHNEALTDFKRPENRSAMEAALAVVAARLGEQRTLLIDGQHLKSESTFLSLNPSRTEQVVGVHPKASVAEIQQAVAAADRAFATWRHVTAEERSDYLFRAAAELRRRKHEFSAWLSYEAGKTWAEADADTAEAIDFLEFYARENLRYAAVQPTTSVPGEATSLVYLPLGVVAVIPPWNFPLAIMVGMTAAALVTGNTVVLKPSSETPTIAHELVLLLESLGLPRGVLNLVTGSGAEVGDALVAHPRTRMIAFTGSRDVGLHINELAARPQPGQIWVKRVIAEMGGKDAIVVDRDADLDLAAQAVAASAFGYQGQKCSACSRVIVDAAVHDDFVERLLVRVSALRLGPAMDPGSDVGPVISARALRSILAYIEVGKDEGRLAAGGHTAGDDSGHYVAPTVFVDVPPRARIAQEEIFGPVLAVIRARDFDDALGIANDSEYGLTGAVFSRDRAKLERARREFFVGNLYLNRKCTGALVGGHPFGGFNMSGTDSKAGGRDYLLLFLQAQAIAEKVIG